MNTARIASFFRFFAWKCCLQIEQKFFFCLWQAFHFCFLVHSVWSVGWLFGSHRENGKIQRKPARKKNTEYINGTDFCSFADVHCFCFFLVITLAIWPFFYLACWLAGYVQSGFLVFSFLSIMPFIFFFLVDSQSSSSSSTSLFLSSVKSVDRQCWSCSHLNIFVAVVFQSQFASQRFFVSVISDQIALCLKFVCLFDQINFFPTKINKCGYSAFRLFNEKKVLKFSQNLKRKTISKNSCRIIDSLKKNNIFPAFTNLCQESRIKFLLTDWLDLTEIH